MTIKSGSNSGKDDLIFGKNAVLAFLKSGHGDSASDNGWEAKPRSSQVNKIFLARGLRPDPRIEEIKQLAKLQSVPLHIVEKENLDRMVGKAQLNKHQGIAAQISCGQVIFLLDFLKDLVKKTTDSSKSDLRHPVIVVLDGIEDPHNLGAIIRVAEAAGASGLVLPAWRAATLTGAVAKASAGALAHLPIVRGVNLVKVIEDLKKAGFWTAALDHQAPATCFQADLGRPLALVIGSEGKGVSRLVARHCDFAVRIPMFGLTESLNASVAAGIVLYEFVRQNWIGLQKPSGAK